MEYCKNIILIGGTGRSGTTIFRRLMENHSEITTTSEWRVLTDPDGIVEYLRAVQSANPFRIDQAYRRLNSILKQMEQKNLISRAVKKISKHITFELDRKIIGSHFGVYAPAEIPRFRHFTKKYLEDLINGTWRGDYASLRSGQSKINITSKGYRESIIATSRYLNNIADHVCELHKKQIYLEKNTLSILDADLVLDIYPTAKLIYIGRDPRDIVASFMKQPWMPSSAELAAYTLKHMLDRWKLVKNQLDDKRIKEIKLEDLVADPKKIVRSCCEYWGIEFEDALLNINLDKSNSGRWQQDLRKDEQKIVTEILHIHIKEYEKQSV